MKIPHPLPDRFQATLAGRVHAVLTHDLLRDGRQRVDVPKGDDAPLSVQVDVDARAGTVRLVTFPEVEVEVDTALGRIRAVITIRGRPEGTFHRETGQAQVEADLDVDVRHFLARDSRVRLPLATGGRLDELAVEGDPLDPGDAAVVLVGQGTFEGGSLDGGALALALVCTVTDVTEP